MSTNSTDSYRKTANCWTKHPNDGGFALITTVIIVLIAGILLSGTVSMTRETERTAGNAIQYSRAMEAAEGAAVIAQNKLIANIGKRSFADSTASEGVFSLESVSGKWWQNPNYAGQHVVDTGVLLGVATPPSLYLRRDRTVHGGWWYRSRQYGYWRSRIW